MKGKHAAAQDLCLYQLRVLMYLRAWLRCDGWASHYSGLFEDPLQALLQSHRAGRASRKREFGQTSSAAPGEESNLPVLTCSVNALGRLLWGVPATSLRLTDDFHGESQL